MRQRISSAADDDEDNDERLSTELRAIAENTIAATEEETSYTEGVEGSEDDAAAPVATDVPMATRTGASSSRPRITSVSRDVAVEQDFWKTSRRKDDLPPFPGPPEGGPDYGSLGGTAAAGSGEGEEAIVDYDLFPESITHPGEDDIPADGNIIVMGDADSKLDDEQQEQQLDDDTTDESPEDSTEDEEITSSDDDSSSAIRSTIAKSALLHRAGIAGAAKKSSRSNGRSSKARTHVNKRGSGRSSVGSLGIVLGTVRTAAAAAAAVERMKASEEKDDEGTTKASSAKSVAKGGNNLTNAIKSTVADMMQTQDAIIQQQSLGTLETARKTTSSPPPGTTSMGLLGDVVEEKLPTIPPLPGTFLFRSTPTVDNLQDMKKPQVTIRASIPHSTDDTHIANLRLSVFSRFDEEQQQIFRSRSVEVLNVRRRRGAVVLVAEVPEVPQKEEEKEEEAKEKVNGKLPMDHYPTEMQARIAKGSEYGNVDGKSSSSLMVTPIQGAKITSVSSGVTINSPSLTVTPIRGAKITSVSSGVTVESPSLTVTPIRGAKITSVSSGVTVSQHDSDIATIKRRRTNHKGRSQSTIIGSVECSHQEFRGTMLGNSRPKGSLMYVTEVAVRTDARRCGAGATLMGGVDEVAALRNIETIYLHVDVENRAACAMYEKCGYRYLDKREPIYAQFTASLNLHDGAMHGRKHYLMYKNRMGKTTWLEDDDDELFLEEMRTRGDSLGLLAKR
eukprot:CAMPEP_0183744096 /NCGR_PEP_ID=MMETSP0737-20130205/65556_1 /TAXON_ID=385413 /ORGANISM="Thalassiosira miniscula, Strain CCMP1093" /LENGTH=731 /DNA_ID=CAMNT_0025979731 /DNA_START=439 /DNA_END=2635 /DNA_ORIENTATION=-